MIKDIAKGKSKVADAWAYLRRNNEQKKYGGPKDAYEAIRRAEDAKDATKNAEIYSFIALSANANSDQYKNHFPIRALSDELKEIELVVSGARISHSRKDILATPYVHSKEVVRDEEHGIDKILESAPLRRQKLERAIREHPLSNIKPDEVADIKTAIKLYEKKGGVSPQLARKYIKEVEASAGVPHEVELTREEKMRQEGIARSNQVYAERMAKKEKEREKYFMGPTKGRHMVEGESVRAQHLLEGTRFYTEGRYIPQKESRLGRFSKWLKEKISPEFKYRAAEK